MRCTKTLETAQSVLQIFEAPGYVEYRVYERRRAPTPSGMTMAWTWQDAILPLFFAILYGSKVSSCIFVALSVLNYFQRVHVNLQVLLTLLGLLDLYRRLTRVRYGM
jgi:hypothetical protein